MGGVLVVVATPIGNLADLSPRAAETLREADLILAEDTRRTGRLLAHIGSAVPQLSLHEHNERERTAEILARLEAGETIAVVSDAGTPSVSDPGFRLVAACAAAGIRVEPVPGPSAALAALVVSGMPTDRVALEGFLPRKGAARRRRLEELGLEPRTMVLFVTPHRADADLRDLAQALGGERPAALSRELTKLHEQVVRGTLDDLVEHVGAKEPRGELTLVVAGAPAVSAPPMEVLVDRVGQRVAAGAPTSSAVAEVAAETGVRRRELYQAVLEAGG